MKVIKVLVDEMPENCKECIYPNWNSLGDRYCQAALRIIYDDKKRPDWCPLIKDDDYVAKRIDELTEEFERDSKTVETRPESEG